MCYSLPLWLSEFIIAHDTTDAMALLLFLVCLIGVFLLFRKELK